MNIVEPSLIETHSSPTPETEWLFRDSKAFFQDLETAIDNAGSRIWLEYYGFEKDPVGESIARALVKASERGIDIRVLVDGIGSMDWSDDIAPILDRAGIPNRVFHPAPWLFWTHSKMRRPQRWYRRFIFLLFRFNRRDHRKLAIIDDLAWVGSANLRVVHIDRGAQHPAWRDTCIRLTGDAVDELAQLFRANWDPVNYPKKHLPYRVDNKVRSNETLRKRLLFYRDFLMKIRSARRRVWLTSAYFVPDVRLIRSLKEAAKHGVDVRILVAGPSDIFFIPWAASTYYTGLIKHGVRVFEYRKSVLHAKSALIDDWGQVGTSNLNHRSLLHDLEIDIVVTDQHSTRTLEQFFLDDIRDSLEICEPDIKKRYFLYRILGKIILFIRKWI